VVREGKPFGPPMNADQRGGLRLWIREMRDSLDRRLMDNRDAVEAKIRRGLEQLDRGEDIPGDRLDASLAKRKASEE